MTVSTIEKLLAAISTAHRSAGFESPRGSTGLRAVIQGIRRSIGTAQAGKVPIGVVELRSAVEALPEGLLGKRDRALLTLGFAGAFRRSEPVGLDVADISFVQKGMEVLIRRSKTDQEAKGREVGIPFGGSAPTCPVRAVQDWLSAGKIESGPLLRMVDRHGRVGADRLGDRAVALSIKRAVAAIGLDPAGFGGHSLRSGFCTAAARAGKSVHAIQCQTGHRSLEMLHRYIRSANLFEGNAAYGIGL